jgi:glycosyltransferase involved in cell wall biosynthesis
MEREEPYHETLQASALALLFTFGYSLGDWEDNETVERELAIYNELAKHFETVYIFTYGTDDAAKYDQYVAANVEIVDKAVVSNNLLYSLLLPVIHWRTFRDVDVIKTNQMVGSWAAVAASVLFRLQLVVRTGYVYTKFTRHQDRFKRALGHAVEFVAYKMADGIVTSAPHGKAYVEERYNPSGDHRVITNYVETDFFAPNDDPPRENSICFVGRFSEQKNLGALLSTLDGLPYSLTLVGDGPLEGELRRQAADTDVDVTFAGRVPNRELPEIICQHELFVLPSHFEGMPKALLEAMSCGVTVVGTDVAGTADVITDGEDGLLCETSVASLRETIEEVMSDDQKRARLAASARETIVEEYSLETIVQQELALYADLL